MTEIVETILEKFDEMKQELLHNFDIDLLEYDPEDYDDNDDLVDLLSLLFQINEIQQRF